MNNRKLSMLTDLYQLTMAQGYYKSEKKEQAIFDFFYRSNPCGSGYAIFCGLKQLIEKMNF